MNSLGAIIKRAGVTRMNAEMLRTLTASPLARITLEEEHVHVDKLSRGLDECGGADTGGVVVGDK